MSGTPNSTSNSRSSLFRRVAPGLLLAALIILPTQSHAYIGPGAGLGAIAVTVALILGIVLLIIGLVWYPLKRALKGKRAAEAEKDDLTTR